MSGLKGNGHLIGVPAYRKHPVLDDLPPWRHDAACKGEDVDLFFPTPGESPWDARQICGRCDVRDECLEYALQRPILGIWGGRTEKERDIIRAARRIG